MNALAKPKERPLLVSTPLVPKMLDDSKTQTRRLNGLEHLGNATLLDVREQGGFLFARFARDNVEAWVKCPYGKPGERLWVRETWGVNHIERGWLSTTKLAKDDLEHVAYRADGDWQEQCGPCEGDEPPWRPSIHMPRWASRITLEVAGVRVERLRSISDEDALAEGLVKVPSGDGSLTWWSAGLGRTYLSARRTFEDLWSSVHSVESWNANPWVWVVGFKRVTP